MAEELARIANCTQAGRLLWGTPACWPTGVGADIKRDFLVRGMYHWHILSYLRHFDREQLLVVADSDLLTNANETVNRVFAHVGLPPLDVSAASEEELQRLIDKAYVGKK